jgi:hypothetical protein
MSQALEKQIKKLEDLKKSRRTTFSRVQRKKLESLKKKLAQSKKPTLGDVRSSLNRKGTSFLRDIAIKRQEKAAKAKKKPTTKVKPKAKKGMTQAELNQFKQAKVTPKAKSKKILGNTWSALPPQKKKKPVVKKKVSVDQEGGVGQGLPAKVKPAAKAKQPVVKKKKPEVKKTKPILGDVGDMLKSSRVKGTSFLRDLAIKKKEKAAKAKKKPTTKVKPKAKKGMTQAELNQFKQAKVKPAAKAKKKPTTKVKPKAKKGMTQAELNQFKQAKVKVTPTVKVSKRPDMSILKDKVPGRKPKQIDVKGLEETAKKMGEEFKTPDVIKTKPKTFEDKLRDKFIKGRGGRDAFKSDKQIDSAFESELMEMREGADAGFSYQDQKDYEKVMDERAAKRKSGGQVKRKYGGKVKRKSGGKVFRRGGGQALRGFGKATYSNKMY